MVISKDAVAISVLVICVLQGDKVWGSFVMEGGRLERLLAVQKGGDLGGPRPQRSMGPIMGSDLDLPGGSRSPQPTIISGSELLSFLMRRNMGGGMGSSFTG